MLVRMYIIAINIFNDDNLKFSDFKITKGYPRVNYERSDNNLENIITSIKRKGNSIMFLTRDKNNKIESFIFKNEKL